MVPLFERITGLIRSREEGELSRVLPIPQLLLSPQSSSSSELGPLFQLCCTPDENRTKMRFPKKEIAAVIKKTSRQFSREGCITEKKTNGKFVTLLLVIVVVAKGA